MKRLLLCLVLLGSWLQAAPMLTITNPEIIAPAGSTADVFFSLESDGSPDYYTVISSFIFDETNPVVGEDDPWQDEIGLLGGPVNFVIPPGTDWSGLLGRYAVSPLASLNAVNSVTLRVLIEQFSGDPNECDPETCFVQTVERDVTFRLTVGDVPTEPVPEPGTWALLGGGLSLLLVARRRGQRGRSVAPDAR